MLVQLLTPSYLPFAVAFVVMVGIGLIEAQSVTSILAPMSMPTCQCRSQVTDEPLCPDCVGDATAGVVDERRVGKRSRRLHCAL